MSPVRCLLHLNHKQHHLHRVIVIDRRRRCTLDRLQATSLIGVDVSLRPPSTRVRGCFNVRAAHDDVSLAGSRVARVL